MNIIKYRARGKFNNDWYYGIPVIIKDFDDEEGKLYISDPEGLCYILEPYYNRGYTGISYECDPKTLGMSTGLKDGNNNEIFVGDILIDEVDDVWYIVDYSISDAQFIFTSIYDGTPVIYDFSNDYQTLKIMSNIFDSPELTKDYLPEILEGNKKNE